MTTPPPDPQEQPPVTISDEEKDRAVQQFTKWLPPNAPNYLEATDEDAGGPA